MDDRPMTAGEMAGVAAALTASMAPKETARKRLPPTPPQRRMSEVGRNDPCPCGSEKKFKKCCLAEAKAVGGYVRITPK